MCHSSVSAAISAKNRILHALSVAHTPEAAWNQTRVVFQIAGHTFCHDKFDTEELKEYSFGKDIYSLFGRAYAWLEDYKLSL